VQTTVHGGSERVNRCHTLRETARDGPMTALQNTHIDVLLQAWSEHEELKRRGASIPELVKSRDRLEFARTQARRAA